MKLRLFQVDAFTDHVFLGNPAAICPLEEWLREDRMQAIAAENNLSETAFFSPNGEGYDLRWFTPTTEADLCGHATLATAFVIWNQLGSDARTLRFHTRSGALTVEKKDDLLVMTFPCSPQQHAGIHRRSCWTGWAVGLRRSTPTWKPRGPETMWPCTAPRPKSVRYSRTFPSWRVWGAWESSPPVRANRPISRPGSSLPATVSMKIRSPVRSIARPAGFSQKRRSVLRDPGQPGFDRRSRGSVHGRTHRSVVRSSLKN